MTRSKRNSHQIPYALPCLICGVDSGPVLTLFFAVFGAGLLGMICFIAWGFATKKFNFNNTPAWFPIKAETESESSSQHHKGGPLS